jgi:hypothetical protein
VVAIVSGGRTLAGAGARSQAQRRSHCGWLDGGRIELGVGLAGQKKGGMADGVECITMTMTREKTLGVCVDSIRKATGRPQDKTRSRG